MKNSLSIGKIAGIQIFIHWTFPLIILWIIFSNARSGLNVEQITWSVLFVLTLFVCVTLHELGHALAAKRFHINISCRYSAVFRKVQQWLFAFA